MDGKKLSHCTIVLFLGLLFLTASPANALLDCVTGVIPSLLPCQNFLTNLLPILPTTQCCSAAKNFTGLDSPKNLCQCLKLNLLTSGILSFKLELLPNLCSITGLLDIVSCIVQPSTPKLPTA
ncbi:hypothetical protein Salat_0272700 [Sesamum alatum]|uniref:Bifunctional inhibitor/plant lipid transfer protein/seed storage helical domain-containing protein n=1 Tax=Sesamum alatum TaxID=300844 RepID=A0AAE1Z0Z7_9LAMI|nr:hypothetical protein Salat_0272700 [Sesamum alatum]